MLLIVCLTTIISATLLVTTCECKQQQDTDHAQHNQQQRQLSSPPPNRLLVMALVEDPFSESFIRFNQSVEAYNLSLSIISAFRGQKSTEEINHDNNNNNIISDSTTTTNTLALNRKFKSITKALASYRNEPDLVILLTIDSGNLILNGDKRDILSRLNDKYGNAKLLFSADTICWPDSSLDTKYLQLDDNGTTTTTNISEISSISKQQQRFLDSRTLIGYAPVLWEFFASGDAADAGIGSKKLDELLATRMPKDSKQAFDNYFQLFATNAYLDLAKRKHFSLELDSRAELFENLHSTNNDVELELDLNGSNVKNTAYNTRPVVIHGSEGSSQVLLNSLGNYLGRAWTQRNGCRMCNSTMISLATTKEADLPVVLIGVFIEEPTPFLEYFFDHLVDLNYPKQRLHLFVHNSVKYHAKQVAEFWQSESVAQYASKELMDWQESIDANFTEAKARDFALKKCTQLTPTTNCDYYFALDSVAHLESSDTLRLLIETNRNIVGPALSRPGKLWSNFWASITTDGYYSRSHDYVSLVTRERLGVWNVPLLMNAYLINGEFLRSHLALVDDTNTYLSQDNYTVLATETATTDEPGSSSATASFNPFAYYDAEYPIIKPLLIFSRNLRRANIYQFVSNVHDFGHLVDPTSFNTSRLHADFYQLENNMIDWEQKYLHDNYSSLFEDDELQNGHDDDDDEAKEKRRLSADALHLESPCQDVYWFPLVNELFCRQLIEIMETFGQWSGGTNSDPRIEGGYESVPTRDIHFKQVGLHEMWLTFLREYVMPIQLKEFIGYEHDPPRTDLAFVVRYHPSEQASLRAHHDSSTYTLNIALNEPGSDYQGGGCRFVRYNCSVTESRRGWALIHPGRLTHYHEGLPVTNGTRYILVTFVDP